MTAPDIDPTEAPQLLAQCLASARALGHGAIYFDAEWLDDPSVATALKRIIELEDCCAGFQRMSHPTMGELFVMCAGVDERGHTCDFTKRLRVEYPRPEPVGLDGDWTGLGLDVPGLEETA